MGKKTPKGKGQGKALTTPEPPVFMSSSQLQRTPPIPHSAVDTYSTRHSGLAPLFPDTTQGDEIGTGEAVNTSASAGAPPPALPQAFQQAATQETINQSFLAQLQQQRLLLEQLVAASPSSSSPPAARQPQDGVPAPEGDAARDDDILREANGLGGTESRGSRVPVDPHASLSHRLLDLLLQQTATSSTLPSSSGVFTAAKPPLRSGLIGDARYYLYNGGVIPLDMQARLPGKQHHLDQPSITNAILGSAMGTMAEYCPHLCDLKAQYEEPAAHCNITPALGRAAKNDL